MPACANDPRVKSEPTRRRGRKRLGRVAAAVVALVGLGAETFGGLVKPYKGCTYDPGAAEAPVEYFRYLRHSKGEWAGKPFELEEWQAKLLRAAFGWKRPDGTRLIRKIYLEVPRKNGKSTLAAGIALYLATADKEAGAEVYSAAADKDQARIVFTEAVRMVNASPDLSEICTVFKTSVFVAETASSYKVISSGANTKHGFNPHGTVIDELHAFKGRELFDVLTTGQGARRQPMTVMITTAGFDRHSVCWEEHDYAAKVRDGVIDDPSLLPVIFAAGEHDDWKEEATWAKANPNLGVSVSIDFLRDEFRKARESPGRENTFKRLYLNIWTEQESRWLSLESWDACEGEGPIVEEELLGRPCWGGLDLSNTSDLTALVWVFPARIERDGEPLDVYDILPRLWLPEESADKRWRNSRVPYPAWAEQGLITLTPGNVIDHEFIREQILQDRGKFEVKEIAYDPYNAIQICSKLHNDDGVPMIEHRQGFVSMADPTKTLEAMVLSRRVRHGAHPVLRWQASNVVVRQDPAGNLKPDKSKAFEKIDAIVAFIMGLGRAVLRDGGSVYDERGLIVI